jgi:hypothetical protein
MINKNAFKMRPLLAAVIVATGLVASIPLVAPKAQAVYLVSDAAAYVQDTYANMHRMIESSQELAYLKSQLDSIQTFAEMSIDTVNNGFANVISRLDSGEEDRQNLEQMERSQPNTAACGVFTAADGIKEASCASEDKMDAFVDSRSNNHSMSTGGGTFKCTGTSCNYVAGQPPSVDDVNKKNTVDAIKTIDRCKQLISDKDGRSLCEHSELMMFKGPLTDDEYEAVDIQLGLASNINKPVPYADDSIEADTPQAKRARAADLRRENMREFAIVAQKNLHMLMNGTRDKKEGNKKGEIEVLDTYMSERLGSQNWMCEVTQSCTDATVNYVAPPELEKRKIEMEAVLLHIALQNYKSSLRVEKYLTDMNLMQIESVTK